MTWCISSDDLRFLQGVDLRQYSKQIEKELLEVENASIKDCILSNVNFQIVCHCGLNL